MKAALEKLVEDGGIIDQYCDETEASAEADMKMNHSSASKSYREEGGELKGWIRARIDWVNEHFNELDNLVHKITFIADEEVYTTLFLAADEPIDGSEPYPEKEGYTFTGWVGPDDKIIENSIKFTEDTVITAQYVPDSEMTHGQDIALRKNCDIVRYSPFFRTYQIQYEVIPADADDQKVGWTSSDEGLATVSSEGLVIFHGTGTVVLTAKLRLGTTRQFTLTITDEDLPVPKEIFPDEEVINMKVGEQTLLMISTAPSPAQIMDYAYESEDPDVVTVDEFGVLTAIGPGTSRVRVQVSVRSETRSNNTLETFAEVIVSEESEEPDESEAEDGDEVPDTGERGDRAWIPIMALSFAGFFLVRMGRQRERK